MIAKLWKAAIAGVVTILIMWSIHHSLVIPLNTGPLGRQDEDTHSLVDERQPPYDERQQ